MKAIIMCAGKSTRTMPLTVGKPKPLLKILDKSIIQHNLKQLEGLVNEVIIIVGFEKDKIKEHIGQKYKTIKVNYVEQTQQLGTGHAVLVCEKEINKDERFIVMNGDDLYSKIDIMSLIASGLGALGKKVEDTSKYGIITVNKDSELVNLVEKPKEEIKGVANIGLYLLDCRIFQYLKKTKKSERGEIELTSGLLDYVKGEKIKFKITEIKDYWLPLVFPWSYLEANVFFLKRISNWKKKGKIGQNVALEGDVFIEEGSIIKPFTTIEGPAYIGKNCEIGPYAHIRPDTIILDNCRIGKTEIYDAVVMQGTTSKHTAYLGHSVIGENVNIGAGTITADYRHDGKNHITLINGNKVDSGRRKLGAFIGDNVKTGIGTIIYPGRKLWPNTTTLPGEVISEDKIN
jgi:bifunctional UDP-N-acetylglucosamine pyrophosphorylase/glucosamine-1-phosphate N-acetyltransferase